MKRRLQNRGEQFAALDQVKVVPQRRPEPPKPKAAETTQRKKPAEPAKTESAASKNENKSVEDDIASLLNKQEPASSGAKRSDQTASLGTRNRAQFR